MSKLKRVKQTKSESASTEVEHPAKIENNYGQQRGVQDLAKNSLFFRQLKLGYRNKMIKTFEINQFKEGFQVHAIKSRRNKTSCCQNLIALHLR